ncbi:MAG: hypothetical protein P4N60_02750 [Verrucomicrobiae bacterium]|nr:hypothetical protein [Verrucomicrobiae bacterium]
MKLPIAFLFQPAQEFTVRIATSAQELTRRRQPPAWNGGNGRNGDQCATQSKRRWRTKFRRDSLQMEAV